VFCRAPIFILQENSSVSSNLLKGLFGIAHPTSHRKPEGLYLRRSMSTEGTAWLPSNFDQRYEQYRTDARDISEYRLTVPIGKKLPTS
jgi:hypothetical protein